MTIRVCSYAPGNSNSEKRAQEVRLFCDNLALLVEHEQEILACSEYFFCPLPFVWCSFLWVGGSGPLCLGHFLLGWRNRILTEQCDSCSGTVLITCFGGSALSGRIWCFGFCQNCRQIQKSYPAPSIYEARLDFALAVRRQYPQAVSYWEEYDGFIFSFGGNGLQPARKKRLVVKPVVIPVSLEVLLEDLKSGSIRTGNPPKARVVPFGYDLELRFKNGSTLTHPVKLIGPAEQNNNQ